MVVLKGVGTSQDQHHRAVAGVLGLMDSETISLPGLRGATHQVTKAALTMRVEIEVVGVLTMMVWHQSTLRRVKITFFLIVAETKTKGQARKGSIMSTGSEL